VAMIDSCLTCRDHSSEDTAALIVHQDNDFRDDEGNDDVAE
jgi:hypothetical protein